MKASESFRRIQNGPVGYIAKYYSDIYLGDIEYEELGNYVAEIKTGKTPSKSQSRYYESQDCDWFKPDEIGKSLYLDSANSKLSKFAVSSNQVTIYKPKTLLINCIGDIGRVSILTKEASSNQQITGILLNEEVLPEYMFYYLLSHRGLMEADASSTTLAIINQKKLLTIPFRKPSDDQQKEIVALLNYAWECWENDINPAFDDFKFEGGFLDMCYRFFLIDQTQKQLVEQINQQQTYLQLLRQTILQEAVQGKLTKQDLTDEPASELLKRIKAEKESLIKAGKHKKEKELPPITEDEIPFDLPEGWVWCRLADISLLITDGTHKTPNYLDKGIPFISAQNIHNNKIDFDNTKYIHHEEYLKYFSNKKLKVGDVLLAKSGRLGIAAVFTMQKEYAFYESIALIRPFQPHINSTFLSHFLNYNSFSFIEKHQKGIGVKHLHLIDIKKFLFPLGPTVAQERTVSILQQLQQQLSQLETQVEQSRQYSQQLLQSVLKEAFDKQEKLPKKGQTVFNMVAEDTL